MQKSLTIASRCRRNRHFIRGKRTWSPDAEDDGGCTPNLLAS